MASLAFEKVLLSEKLKSSLLRLEARLYKVLERLLTKSVLLLGYDTAVLVLH